MSKKVKLVSPGGGNPREVEMGGVTYRHLIRQGYRPVEGPENVKKARKSYVPAVTDEPEDDGEDT